MGKGALRAVPTITVHDICHGGHAEFIIGPRIRDPLALPPAFSPLLHQRVARRGQLQKFARAAAGVRVRALGDALVGAVDLGAGQTATERQSQ